MVKKINDKIIKNDETVIEEEKIRLPFRILLIGILLVIVILSLFSLKSMITNYGNSKKNNIELLLDNNKNSYVYCISKAELVDEFILTQNKIIKTLKFLNINKYITKRDTKILTEMTKNLNLFELEFKLQKLELLKLDIISASTKEYLLGLVNELNFNKDTALKQYKKAIGLDKFNYVFLTTISDFYKKTCVIEEAKENLEKAITVLNNSGNYHQNSIENVYMKLGDIYFLQNDHNNAFIYYNKAYMSYEIKGFKKEQVEPLLKMADILSKNGDYNNSIKYYNYALKLKKFTTRKKQISEIYLKLSQANYNYGNYEVGLKHANNLLREAKKENKKFLLSNAYYLRCLNNEYLKNSETAKNDCFMAKKIALEYVNSEKDYLGYMFLAKISNFASYLRNYEFSMENLEKAYKIVEMKNNIFKKIDIMETIAHNKVYNEPEESIKIIEENLKELYDADRSIIKNSNNNLLLAFAYSNLDIEKAENIYLSNIENIKDKKVQLLTAYDYLSELYSKNNNKEKSLYFAKKSLNTALYVYKYDHHYVKYIENKIDRLLASKL